MNIETINQNIESFSYITPRVEENIFDIKFKLQDIIENFVSVEEPGFSEQLNEKFLNLDFGAEFNIVADKIGANDAVFFVNLLNQQNLISYSVEKGEISLFDANSKPINATKSLLAVLENSYSTNKPVRLDFDNNITVIIKLDKEGKIQAHFIPGNPEVESYLKNNIPILKQRFDDEQINYSYLGYRQDKGSKKEKRSKK